MFCSIAMRLAKGTLAIALLLFSSHVSAGQQMKCSDGTGRVIYTDLSSCVEALRQAPSSVKPDDLKRADLKEKIKREREAILQDRKKLNQNIADRKYKEKIDREYAERVRLQEADERQQKECELMKFESNRRYQDAQYHGSDSWWQHRSEAYDQEYELKCGKRIGLR